MVRRGSLGADYHHYPDLVVATDACNFGGDGAHCGVSGAAKAARLMALRGGLFLQNMRGFRICWLAGRYGGGKTALAVRTGMEFVERGWAKHIVCNFPCIVATHIWRLDKFEDVFLILDEAGSWLSEKQFDTVVAFLRKRNVTVAFPTVLKPPTRATTFNIQRTVNFQTMGVPLWWYSAQLDYLRVKEKLTLQWWNPQEVFGLFDTANITNSGHSDGVSIMTRILDEFYSEPDDTLNHLPTWARERELARAARVAARTQKGGRGTTKVGYPADGDGAGLLDLEEFRRVAQEQTEAADKLTEAVSVAQRKGRRGRG